MNIFGHNFRLAIWGESHGQQIGISIDGIPAGVPLSAEDFANRPRTAAQRRARHHAAPRTRHPADRVGTLQRHDHGRPADHRVRQPRHPLAGLRQRDAPLPALARRHGGLPQIQRLQRPARRRPLLGPPDRGAHGRRRGRQEDTAAGRDLRHPHRGDRRLHRPGGLRRGAARRGRRAGLRRRHHRMPRAGRSAGAGTALLRLGRRA